MPGWLILLILAIILVVEKGPVLGGLGVFWIFMGSCDKKSW